MISARLRIRRARFFAFAVALAFGFAPVSHAQDDAAVKDRIVRQIEKLQAEKKKRTKAQAKIASALLEAARQRKTGAVSPGVPALRSDIEADAAGRVAVEISATASPDLLAAVGTFGGDVLHSSPRSRSIRARVPLDRLETLAARPEVKAIRPAAKATTNAQTVFSEGDIAHRAGLARNTFGVTGAGVKIGVLSDSVDHLSRSQANGELAEVTILPGQSGIGLGNSGEGTAMLEIVRDVAPGAELFFASAFLSPESFAENIRDLAAAGCSVIIDDVTYFDESPFQDGIVSRAVNDVSAQGVLYFSSARNSGNQGSGTSGAWEGDFKDGGAAGKGGRFLDFGGGKISNRVQRGGSSRRVDFFWADPLGASSNDYDVFVVNAQGFITARSDDSQTGFQDPYESIGRLRPGERIVIVKIAGAQDRFLHLDTGEGRLAIGTAGSVRGHNASGAANAFSVAATTAFNRGVPFTGGANNPVERFSSDGFRRVFYEADGTPITPGDFSSTGGRVLQKPDVTAADGVKTSVPGFRAFFGTSSAAPHAGAIAALLRSFKPTLTPAEVRAALQSTALDIEEPGFDRNSGAGILDAQAALEAVAGVPNADPVVTVADPPATFAPTRPQPVIAARGIGVTDPDSVDFRDGTFSVTIANGAESADELSIVAEGFGLGQIGIAGDRITFGGVVVGTFAQGSAISVQFTSHAATPAAVQALARRVAFFHRGENPSLQDRTIAFAVTDGDGGSSAPGTQTVQIASMNSPPSFRAGPDVIVRGDTSMQTIANWAADIRPGPPADAGQALEFLVETSEPSLFAVAPAISADGKLTFQAAQGASGVAEVSVVLMDDAGGGFGASAPQAFRIFIEVENLPPGFIAGPDILVAANSPVFMQTGWATEISAGPGEDFQTVAFLVMADRPELFSSGPSVSPEGVLTFTPALNASGVATVTVRLMDDAGGLDIGEPQTFRIAVATFAEEIGVFNGLIEPAPGEPRDFRHYGIAKAVVSRTGALSAKLTLSGVTFSVKGTVGGDGTVRFAPGNTDAIRVAGGGSFFLLLSMKLDASQGTDRLNGTFASGTGPYSLLSAGRAVFDEKTNPVPPAMAGRYTAAFLSPEPLAISRDASSFPHGDGYAVIHVTDGGAVRFSGRLADGMKVNLANALSKDFNVPFHLLTDRKSGSLSGHIVFRDVPGVSDLDAAGMAWFKPAKSRRKLYPPGWAEGLFIDLAGSRYIPAPGTLPGLAAPNPAGNVLVTLSGASLCSPVPKAVNIDSRSRARIVNRDDEKLAFKVKAKNGKFGGVFRNPVNRKRVKFAGVVIQKQSLGTGFFLDARESGAVSVEPQNP